MSNPLKAVGKVFKSITKSTIGKIVIGAAVAFLTAGIGTAALGALGASSSFLSSTMGTVLSGALSGAAAGGITSALTGGDIGKGMLLGGVGGAVMGGVRSAIGAANPTGTPDPSNAATDVQKVGPMNDTSSITVENLPPAGMDEHALSNLRTDPGMAMINETAPAAVPSSTPAAAAPAAGGGGLLSWIERNQTLVGNVLGGVGQGIMAGAKADAEGESLLKRDQAQRDYIAANYGGPKGLLTQTGYISAQPPRPTPAQRFDPRTYGGQYVYDAVLGRIVFVPNQTA